MTDVLDLTFAELRYLVDAWPSDARDAVLAGLRIRREDDESTIIAAGLASLAARQLVDISTLTPKPADAVKVILAGLYTAQQWVDIGSVVSTKSRGAHFAVGPQVRLLLAEAGAGIYEFTTITPDRTVGEQTASVVAGLLNGASDALVLINAHSPAGAAKIGVGVGADGAWTISDSARNPDGARPCDESTALHRITELVDTTGVLNDEAVVDAR